MSISSTSKPDLKLNDTPHFNNPPIIETVLGVQFKPLADMRITHFGLFYKKLKSAELTTVQEAAPLAHQIEQPEQDLQVFPLGLGFFPVSPLPRVWFLSEEGQDGQQLVQLQIDRLLQNWRRKKPSDASYTSYSKNRAKFQETYSKFADFVKEERLGDLVPDQCEVTYVNRISMADFADTSEAFKKCFNGVGVPPVYQHVSAKPDAIGLNWHYWLNELNGRLTVQSSTASIVGTAEKVIDLRITARGAPKELSVDGIMNWLDLGHYFVVHLFVDMTTDQMHKVWGRIK